MEGSEDTTGIIVVRAWVDGNGHDELRARITSLLDPRSGEEHLSAAAGIEAVCDEVRGWLERMLARQAGA